jgi:uncharacterized protein YgiM (DUF1202 family)
MQNRKSWLAILLLPVFVSLACLSAAEPFITYPADTVTVIKTEVARVTVVSPSPQPSPVGRGGDTCAVISADEALHLRVGPDEHSRSLAFMTSGEVVKLLSAANVDWWRIKRLPVRGTQTGGNQVGYARSTYLEISECRVDAP